jgi:hypothetical protein
MSGQSQKSATTATKSEGHLISKANSGAGGSGKDLDVTQHSMQEEHDPYLLATPTAQPNVIERPSVPPSATTPARLPYAIPAGSSLGPATHKVHTTQPPSKGQFPAVPTPPEINGVLETASHSPQLLGKVLIPVLKRLSMSRSLDGDDEDLDMVGPKLNVSALV